MRWDPARGEIDRGALEGVDAAVHLSGESIAGGRWSTARKKRLYDSRIGSTRTLARALAAMNRPPKVLMSTSAIGYYGSCGDAWLTESSPAADDFLGRLAVDGAFGDGILSAPSLDLAGSEVLVDHCVLGSIARARLASFGGALARWSSSEVSLRSTPTNATPHSSVSSTT